MFNDKCKKILNMSNYGKLVSYIEYLYSDDSLPTDIEYYRTKDKLKVKIFDIDNIFRFRARIQSDTIPFEQFYLLKSKNNLNINDIFARGRLNPIVYGVHNAPKSDEEGYFELELPVGNYKAKFKFANDKHVVVNKDTSITVYNSTKDGTIDTQSKSEEYNFTENGYFVINYDEKYDSYVNLETNTEIHFRLMRKSTMGYRNHIIQDCPTSVIYVDHTGEMKDREFQIKYDRESGLITDIKFLGNNLNKKMCLLIKIETKDSYRYISLHPLLHDRFSFTDISSPHIYWALDYVNITEMNSSNIVSIERKIFELDDQSMYDLFDIINTEGKNIIYVK